MKNKSKIIQSNSFTLKSELDWLIKLIDYRLEVYFKLNKKTVEFPEPNPINNDNSFYAKWIRDNSLDKFERLIVISSIANLFFPEVFDKFLIKNKGLDKRFTEFGGKLDSDKSRFIPTFSTLCFIFYGRDFEYVFDSQNIFDKNYKLNKIGAIYLSGNENDHLKFSQVINLDEEIVKLITLGEKYRPNYSSNFPAKLLSTSMNWKDLVLNPIIMEEVENINAWIEYKEDINKSKVLQNKIGKGYKCLFYGPPGTGKTLTATLLGNRNDIDVYRIDLSQVISKYVGETEKNLSRVFDIAENKNWILFFDEAESLFSKRTSVGDSKDRFANQQTAYLLQRIEEYSGLVILATNLKPNIDRAFSRRIQSTINFSIPTFFERKTLWGNFLNDISDLPEKSINRFSKDYEISGGSIKNVIQYAWLYSKRKKDKIKDEHIIQGIKRELMKDGKSVEINN